MTKDKNINIAANDETIISGANDLIYMYSVNDVHNIAIALRQQYLNYEGMQDANPGEEYAYLRENNNQILLLDAYALQNLQNGIEDDVDKIINEGSVIRWHNPPQTILIPFLTAAHWISIKVDINYNDRSASLLWDNPYGLSYEAGEYEVAGKIISSIDIIANVRSAVERLMKHYLQNNEFTLTEGDGGNWALNYQQMDQQGFGIDGVSCGTITLRNIEDYLDARVNHGQSLPTEYTIPAYKSNYMQNRTKLHAAKKEHVKMYCKVAEEDIPDDTDSILSAFDEQESDRVIAEFEKKLFPQGINHEDSILPNIEEEKAKILAQVKDAYHKTQEYVATSQFKEAEDEIVKILRPVLSKPEAKSLYVSVKDIPTETLNALHHLGQIYLQDSSYYNNHVKASAIFQYCARFSKEYKITIELPDGTAGDEQYFTNQAYLVERDFLSNIGKKVDETASYVEDSANKLELYQSELLAIREITKEELEDIESLGIEQIAERTEKVQDIYKDCTDFFVTPDESQQGLVQRLIFESIEQLGDIPQGCQYSIMGLGSLAFGTMTPWSDLEFAVLIKDEENKGRENEYREYFRNLTKLLWIKVINFGETPLSAVGVDSLNNYKTGETKDNWFEDNITGKAFRFDPVYEDACKSALGRQGDYMVTKKFKNKDGIEETKTIEKPNYELIKTPKEMMEFQDWVLRELPEDDKEKEKEDTLNKVDNTQDSWFYAEKHLVQTLQTPVLINGSKELLGEYRQELKKFRDDNPELVQTRALQILQEDINKFSLKLGDEEEGRLFNAKTTIYRLGDRIVNALANYYGITAEENEHSITIWQILDRMEQRELLSSEGAQHLKEAISISTGLRLSTYSHNEGRFDNISTYVPVVTDHLSERQQKELMEKTFYVQDTSILHHFYYVMLGAQETIKIFSSNTISPESNKNLLKDSHLFTNENHHKGLVHARFLEYQRATECMEKAQEDKPDNISLLNDLYFLYSKTGSIEKSIKVGKLLQVLVNNGFYPNDSNYEIVAGININLGNSYAHKGNYNQAISYYTKASKIYEKLYSLNPDNLFIAGNYNNLGNTCANMGVYDLAIKYYKKSLIICSKISNFNYKNLVRDYNNLGNAYINKSDYKQAIKYYKIALSLTQIVKIDNPNHPDIALIYNNLGAAFNEEGDHDQAIKYCEIAMDIRQQTYSSNLNHFSIAESYNNLANTNRHKGEYDKAVRYYNKALELYKKTFGTPLNHTSAADSYSGLGNVYRNKAEYQHSIECHKKALEIRNALLSEAHPDIGDSYNNLGNLHSDLGHHDQAIKYHLKALNIRKKVYYGLNPNHKSISESYNNLGAAYYSNQEINKAIDYLNIALEMEKTTDKPNLNNSSIADIYNNLSAAYSSKEEYDQAIIYILESLKIMNICYSSIPNHPFIAEGYNNLGVAYSNKKKYNEAIKYYFKALEIFKATSVSNHPSITKCYYNISITLIKNEQYTEALEYASKINNKLLCNFVITSLGNKCLLNYNTEEAKTWYAKIDQIYQVLDFTSKSFVQLQLLYMKTTYNQNYINAAIDCQKVLLQIDSDLKYGNHHHNLACFYVCLGNIDEANDAFINALNHPNAKITGGLYAEYAQFLILNKSNLSNDSSAISKYLYAAVECNNIGGLQYGKIEKSTICSILCNIVKEQSTTIIVNPKILAYYLLITNPEYIAEGDSVENLLSSLKFICGNQQDEISFRLLADAYKFVGNEELSEESLIFSSMLSQVYKIVNKKLNLGDDGCTLTPLDAQKVAEAIDKSATQAILDKRFSDSLILFKKVFQIYNLILSDQIEHLQTAANKLATISLLTNNIQQFIELKFQFHAELNHDLIKSLGKNIDHIIAIEQQIITNVIIAGQKKHTAHATVTNKDTEDQIVSIGETEDIKDST